MSELTNEQKVAALQATPQIMEAVRIMVAAFEDMELKSFLTMGFTFERTDGDKRTFLLTLKLKDANYNKDAIRELIRELMRVLPLKTENLPGALAMLYEFALKVQRLPQHQPQELIEALKGAYDVGKAHQFLNERSREENELTFEDFLKKINADGKDYA